MKLSRRLFRAHEAAPRGSPSRWQAVLVVAAIVALVMIGATLFVVRLDDQIAEEAIARLHAHVDRQSETIAAVLQAASSDLRLARRNVVFDRNILATSEAVSVSDRAAIEAAITYMGERYGVDEICLIRADASEIARYDGGQIAAIADLSPDESQANPAFLPTMRLDDDAVHITAPYVSPDSGRWVYALATPIILSNGSRGGILHFEIPIQAFVERLDRDDFASGAYAFLLQRDGSLLSHPDLPAFRAAAGLPVDPDTSPFPPATASGSEGWRALVGTMLAGGSGEASFRQDGRGYRVVFARTNGGNDIVGTAVPEDVLFADVRRSRTDLIVTLGPLVILMLGISAWFASRLSGANRRLELSGRASAQLAAIVVAADDAILRTDLDGRIVTWNNGAQRLYGYTKDDAVGRSMADLVAVDRRPEVAQLLASVSRGEAVERHETVHMTGDGHSIDTMVTFSPIRNARGEVTACSVIVRDISQRKRLEEELTHQALHDSLTGLPNRVLFLDRLGHGLAAAEREDRELRRQNRLAVLFLDVDDFKVVNDSLGHRVGDELLKAIADRLSRAIRPGDTAARLGGDEFTVLLEEIADVGVAEASARRIQRHLEKPFDVQSHRVVVTVSIGISMSGDGAEPSEILRRADLAMYEAKAKGKARHAVFNISMNERAWRRLELETELRLAIANDQLQVHYQPIFNLDSGDLHSLEALIRWEHSKYGWIEPAEFIPLAEQTGLIVPIGEFVLESACRQLAAWARGRPKLRVSVNVSPRQLQEPEFIDVVKRVLHAHAIDPQNLQMEITEGLLQEDEACIRGVATLQAMGVHVALDDFGTGYSSLASIRRLPIDSLKIDQSFVAGVIGEHADAALVSAAISFAKAVGLQLTAEGIETAQQLAALRELGCELGQGFFLARPLAPEDVDRLLGESTDETSARNAVTFGAGRRGLGSAASE